MYCEIIAEIGQNHNGDMELAKDMIFAAKENGADVAKFQLFDARALFPSKEEGNEWFEYNCKTELSYENIHFLYEQCSRAKIEFMASAFDVQRVKWLEDLGVRRHKVASRSVYDRQLIQAMENTGKPLLVSLGMWDQKNFPEIRSKGGVFFLYCVSKYPTQLTDLNFSNVNFENEIYGFSDHTIGITAPVVAMSRGAKIIEKHFTLDKTLYGPDHVGSMTPNELRDLARFREEISVCLESKNPEGNVAQTNVAMRIKRQ
ncbi:MAG: N-acetylneuraminate synthase family protein [Alphaproteobacteria bacterium]|nr:N-acetylneuraminate synthase family protein [Alphaproteobacteria bacterium]